MRQSDVGCGVDMYVSTSCTDRDEEGGPCSYPRNHVASMGYTIAGSPPVFAAWSTATCVLVSLAAECQKWAGAALMSADGCGQLNNDCGSGSIFFYSCYLLSLIFVLRSMMIIIVACMMESMEWTTVNSVWWWAACWHMWIWPGQMLGMQWFCANKIVGVS